MRAPGPTANPLPRRTQKLSPRQARPRTGSTAIPSHDSSVFPPGRSVSTHIDHKLADRSERQQRFYSRRTPEETAVGVFETHENMHAITCSSDASGGFRGGIANRDTMLIFFVYAWQSQNVMLVPNRTGCGTRRASPRLTPG